MIYQPRNVRPSNISVDGTESNIFSMEVQTNSYIDAYQILIANFDNNIVYTGAKNTLSKKLYNGDVLSITLPANKLENGSDYKWRVRLYQATSDMLITYGLTQNTNTTTNIYTQPNINIVAGMSIKIGSQTRTISSYNSSTGLAVVSSAFSSAPAKGVQYQILSNFIETVPDYIVYARNTPTVSINNIPSPLTLKYYTFQGVYNQADNVPIAYHQFDIYMLNNDDSMTLINTSGKIYSADLSYTYDSFRTGSTYFIQMTIENDMGIISKTNLYTFDVSYAIVEYLQQPQAVFNSKQNAINISWITPVEHDAFTTAVGTTGVNNIGVKYLYNTPYNSVNSLYTQGYTLTWDTPDGLCVLPDNFNITFQFNPDSNFFYDQNGRYIETAYLINTETDDLDGNGVMTIRLNKNNLIFTYSPDVTLQTPLYTGTVDTFVLASGTPQINDDYVWLDSATWADENIWTEGGTFLERVCNHWWKVQITNTTIKVEEIFPTL